MSRTLVTCPDCRREWPARDGVVPWHLRCGTGQSCGPTPWVDPLAPVAGEEPQPRPTLDPRTCPACEWAWRLFGEQGCDAHDDPKR